MSIQATVRSPVWDEFKLGKYEEGEYGMCEFGEDVDNAIAQNDYDTLYEMLTYEVDEDILCDREFTMLRTAIYEHDFKLCQMVVDTSGDKIDYAREFEGGEHIGKCNMLSYACADNNVHAFLYMLDRVDLKACMDHDLMAFIVDRDPAMLKALIDCVKRDDIPFLQENHSNYKTNKSTVSLYRGVYWMFIQNHGYVHDYLKENGKMLDPLLDMKIVRDIAKYGIDFYKDGVHKPEDNSEVEMNAFYSKVFPSYALCV